MRSGRRAQQAGRHQYDDRACKRPEIVAGESTTSAAKHTKNREAREIRFPVSVKKVRTYDRLERNAEPQLDPTAALRAIGRNQFAVDYAKGRWAIDVQRGVEEIHMIEQVEEVG